MTGEMGTFCCGPSIWKMAFPCAAGLIPGEAALLTPPHRALGLRERLSTWIPIAQGLGSQELQRAGSQMGEDLPLSSLILLGCLCRGFWSCDAS